MAAVAPVAAALGLPALLNGGGTTAPPPPPAALSSALQVDYYFGNLHTHTAFGEDDGKRTVKEGVPEVAAPGTYRGAFDYARSTGDLDFMAITPHSHMISGSAYQALLKEVRDTHYSDIGLVPLAGQEYSTNAKGNQINVFQAEEWIAPQSIPNQAFGLFYQWLADEARPSAILAQFDHPTSRAFKAAKGAEWPEYGLQGELAGDEGLPADAWDNLFAVEIMATDHDSERTDSPHWDQEGSRLKAYYRALNLGWWVGPTANQDNHYRTYGTASECRTVAVAEGCTRPQITDALRQRRFYASEDSDLRVTFLIDGQWMGSTITLGQTPQALGVTMAAEDDESGATYAFDLLKGFVGGSKPEAAPAPVEAPEYDNSAITTPQSGTYYLLHVVQNQPDGHVDEAWTAPIWIE